MEETHRYEDDDGEEQQFEEGEGKETKYIEDGDGEKQQYEVVDGENMEEQGQNIQDEDGQEGFNKI